MERLGVDRIPGTARIDPTEASARRPEIEHYCSVVAQSNDIEELRSVSGMLDFFHTQTEVSNSHEVDTGYLIARLKVYQDTPCFDNHRLVQNWRCYAMAHSLRAMVQGTEYSIFDIPKSSEMIASHIDSVDNTIFKSCRRGNRQVIVDEMTDVLRFVPWNPDLRQRYTIDRAEAVLESAAPSLLWKTKAGAKYMIGTQIHRDQGESVTDIPRKQV